MGSTPYSALDEAQRIFSLLCKEAEELGLPSSLAHIKGDVVFKSDFNRVYFPIPLKETETSSALKGLEGCVAVALADLRYGWQYREVKVDLEKATCFLFQTYIATICGLGKFDKGVQTKLKGK